MNLKQNTWMYLFCASLLLWLGTITFSCNDAAPKADKVSETSKAVATVNATNPCQGYKPDTYELDKGVAEKSIRRYREYKEGNPNKENPNNDNVRYFSLPHCELATIVESVDEGADMKAHLAIKDIGATDEAANGKYTGMIIMIFEDTKSSKYYDFVDPCPLICDKQIY